MTYAIRAIRDSLYPLWRLMRDAVERAHPAVKGIVLGGLPAAAMNLIIIALTSGRS